MVSKIKIPLFDLDGTIFKAGNLIHNQAFDYAFTNIYNLKASQSEINGQGMTDRQIFHEVLKLHGLSREQIEEKILEAQKMMAEYFIRNSKNKEFIVLPGVKELLIALREREIPIGILTGNLEKIAWKKLELAGIKDYFDFGAFGGITDKRTELVKIAKERADVIIGNNVPLKNFVIVGDTPKDIDCAKAVEIPVIAVSTGKYSLNELAKFNPDLLIESLEEKQKVINFLLN